MNSGVDNWPPAFTVAEIREVCGPWSYKRLQRVLRRAGVLDEEQHPSVVHEHKLKEHFPIIWQRLYQRRVLAVTTLDE